MLSPTPPIRLCSILGYDDRVNDVVFCPPAIQSDEHSTVIYFGGDVQDFPEVMKLHSDNKNYIKWNLESMAAMLNLSFPHSHIVVVRPSRIEFKTFSCYKNFVPSGNAGVPEHTPTHYALQHLERLLIAINQRIKSKSKAELRNMISTSLESQQCYMDVDLSQVSIESINSNSKQQVSAENVSTSILQRELESNKSLTVTMSNVHNEHYSKSQNSVPDHHVTITSSKQNLNITNESNKQDSIIQLTSTSSPDASSVDKSDENDVCTTTTAAAAKNNKESRNSNLNSLWWYDNIALDKAKLILIGFSKGCVVLNQLIYEFHYLKTLTPDDSTMLAFVSRITEMFWLDGGHAGGKNTWITSRSLLETLTRLGIKIWIHVTPYQVQDDRRAWIRREEQTFTELLQRLGAHANRTLHFDGANPDLHMHFDILSVFKTPEDVIKSCPEK